MKTGILSLGTRSDAGDWEKGCKGLGFDAPLPIKDAQPDMESLKAFFARPAEWLYIGGHFLSPELYNEAHDVSVQFYADRIDLRARGERATLRKGTEDFKLAGVSLIVWAGCSTLGSREFVAAMNSLFGSHLMIGFRRMTGIPMCSAMFTGGGFIKRPFFSRVGADPRDAGACRKAWLEAALEGYGGGENEDRFAAIDPDGTSWTIAGNSITSGARFY